MEYKGFLDLAFFFSYSGVDGMGVTYTFFSPHMFRDVVLTPCMEFFSRNKSVGDLGDSEK